MTRLPCCIAQNISLILGNLVMKPYNATHHTILSCLFAAEPLPQTDPEIMDWMSDIMADAAKQPAGAGKSSDGALSFINFNTGYEYCGDLGFFVALDGAARLPRLLPAAGLVSYSPPGSLYQVNRRNF